MMEFDMKFNFSEILWEGPQPSQPPLIRLYINYNQASRRPFASGRENVLDFNFWKYKNKDFKCCEKESYNKILKWMVKFLIVNKPIIDNSSSNKVTFVCHL